MSLAGLPARVLVLGIVLSAPAQSQARWPVDARPLLDIAGTSDNGDVAFGSANWAVRLPDGRVVVADAGAPGLRFFDANGKFVRQSGRSGQGPGEMRTVTWVGHCGAGRIYAWDWTQFRLVEFDTAGTYRRMVSVTATPTPFSVACSPTGVFAFLGIPQRRDMTQTAAGTTAGVVNGISPFVLADSNGTATVTLGEYSPGELVAGAGAEGMRPLGRWTTFAVSSDRVYLGTAEAPAVECFDLRGRGLTAPSSSCRSRSSSLPTCGPRHPRTIARTGWNQASVA